MPVGVSNFKAEQKEEAVVVEGYTQFKLFQRDISQRPENNPGSVLPAFAEQDVSNYLQDGWKIIYSSVQRRVEGVDNPNGIVYTIVLFLVK